MSTSRHTSLAYLLLAVTLALLLKFLAMPLISNLSSQHKANRALQNEVSRAQAQLAEAEQANTSVQLETAAMIDRGRLVYASKASEAGHQLQELLKSIMLTHSLSISQLRPNNEAFSDSFSKSRLELNFELPSNSLNGLLISLSESQPSLDIELISLRSNRKYSPNIQNNLEVSLGVAMWYTTNVTFAPTGEIDVGERVSRIAKVGSETNILAGLFDPNIRSRFRAPSPTHYRLAAINISQSSRIAIIANSGDGKIRRLETGDMLDAWRLESIDSSSVSLKIGDRQEVLNLLP
ncbi:MAG: hypothetical protein ACJA2E_001055 [Arenicella sp.]|jgi:hypothetical protein